MTADTPSPDLALRDALRDAGATFIPVQTPAGERAYDLAGDFGAYPLEYAAIHRSVAIVVPPPRGIIQLTGSDVKDFLHRLLTADINGMTGGASRRAMQLNEKGRIVADMIVHHGDESTWLEMDASDVPAMLELLDSRLFSEDVAMEEISTERVQVSLLGPSAAALMQAVSEGDVTGPANMPGTHHVVTLAGSPLTAYRRDVTGSLGLHLHIPTSKASSVYADLLAAAGFDPADDPLAAETAERRRTGLRGRPAGWMAFNTARLEAGTAIFQIDFGHDCLPAETGEPTFSEAVSLTKGCYLGQEIVARMQSLGHPKRVLCGVRFEGEALPLAGVQITEAADHATIIGGLTSSALAPRLGQQPIGLAMMKWGKHTPGTRLAAPAEGGWATGEVCGLPFGG